MNCWGVHSISILVWENDSLKLFTKEKSIQKTKKKKKISFLSKLWKIAKKIKEMI